MALPVVCFSPTEDAPKTPGCLRSCQRGVAGRASGQDVGMDDLRARLATLSAADRAALEAQLAAAAAANQTPELGPQTLAALALLAEVMLRAPALGEGITQPAFRRLALFSRLLARAADSADGDAARSLAVAFLAGLSSPEIATYYEFLADTRELPAALAAALARKDAFAAPFTAYHFCVSKGSKLARSCAGVSERALELLQKIEKLVGKGNDWRQPYDGFLGSLRADVSVVREVARARFSGSHLSLAGARIAGLALARAECSAGEPLSPEARAEVVTALCGPYQVKDALRAVLLAIPEPTRAAVLTEALERNLDTSTHPAGDYAHLAPASLPALLAVHDRTTLAKYGKPDPLVAHLVAFGPSAASAIAASLGDRSALGAEVAVRALAQIGTPECAPALVEALGAGKAVHLAALDALKHLGPAASSALEAGAKSKKKAVREASATLLAALGTSATDPVQAIFAELAALPAETKAAFDRALRGQLNVADRRKALAALVKTEHALHALASLRDTKDMEGALSGWDELIALAREHENELTCRVAVEVLVGRPKPRGSRVRYYVGPLAKAGEGAIAPLAKALSGADFPMRTELFELLASLLTPATRGQPDVAAVLLAGLESTSKQIRELAVAEVVKLGAPAVGRVASLLASKRADARAAAAEVLAAIAHPDASAPLAQALAAEKAAPVAAAMERALSACGGVSAPGQPSQPTGRRDVLAELAATKRAKLPAWLMPVLRPVALKAGGALEGDLLAALATRLMNEGPDTEDALARAVRPLLDDAAAHVLSMSILGAWAQKSDPKHKWAVYQQAILASDARIAELGANVSVGNHHFAGWCIDVLVRRGLSTSAVPSVGLSWVAHWARSAETPSLATKAREALDHVAARLGKTKDTLGPAVDPDIRSALRDAAIPSFDLGVLDLGGRTLRVTVGPLTKLVLVAEDGTTVPRLAPTKSDPEAKRAKADFDALSERFDAAVKEEAKRLEQAMVSGRRFAPDAFRALFLEHPWMNRLGERVLFVTEERVLFVLREGSPIGLDYGAVAIGSPVRIAHRDELTAAETSAWATHLAESEVIELFPQLERPAFDGKLELGKKVPRPVLAARLLDRGYRFGRTEDAGNVFFSTKLFPGRGQMAVLEHTGINVQGNGWNDDPATLHAVSFSGLYDRDERLPDAVVDPVVRAEVGRDVAAILR